MSIAIENPNLAGPRSPTPRLVYERRFYKVRIWVPDGPFEGIGLTFRAPYGVAVNASELLARAVARGQILRFTFGAITPKQLTAMTREQKDNTPRYEDAFDDFARAWGIDWGA